MKTTQRKMCEHDNLNLEASYQEDPQIGSSRQDLFAPDHVSYWTCPRLARKISLPVSELRQLSIFAPNGTLDHGVPSQAANSEESRLEMNLLQGTTSIFLWSRNNP